MLLTIAGACLTHRTTDLAKKHLQVVANVWEHWAGWVSVCQLACCAKSDDEVDEADEADEAYAADDSDLDHCLAVLAGDSAYM